jgi:hypothetical protein
MTEDALHKMSVKMTSIVKDIPQPLDIMEEELLPFGTATGSTNSMLGGEKRRRELEDEMQREDAVKRRVIWVRRSWNIPKMRLIESDDRLQSAKQVRTRPCISPRRIA